MGGGQDRSPATGLIEESSPGLAGHLGVCLEPVAHLGVDQLDRVHQHVTGDDDLRGAVVDDDGLVPRTVAGRGYDADRTAPSSRPGEQARDAVHLVQLPGRAQRIDDVAHGRVASRERRCLPPLDDVAGVGKHRCPVRADRPAVVILVQVGQHHRVDIARVDASLFECGRKSTRCRRPGGGGAAVRPHAGVDQHQSVTRAAYQEAAEVEVPALSGTERVRVDAAGAGPVGRRRVREGGLPVEEERPSGVEQRRHHERADRARHCSPPLRLGSAGLPRDSYGTGEPDRRGGEQELPSSESVSCTTHGDRPPSRSALTCRAGRRGRARTHARTATGLRRYRRRTADLILSRRDRTAAVPATVGSPLPCLPRDHASREAALAWSAPGSALSRGCGAGGS